MTMVAEEKNMRCQLG